MEDAVLLATSSTLSVSTVSLKTSLVIFVSCSHGCTGYILKSGSKEVNAE